MARYNTHITLTYRVPVDSTHTLTRQQVLDYIAENINIAEHELIDVDYDNADIQEAAE